MVRLPGEQRSVPEATICQSDVEMRENCAPEAASRGKKVDRPFSIFDFRAFCQVDDEEQPSELSTCFWLIRELL